MTTPLTFAVNDLRGGAIRRLSEATLYVCAACETDAAFGLTRLNKILFEADFFSFFTRGVPITGARYQRLERGPAPKAMFHRLRDMQESGDLFVRDTDYLGSPQKKPITLRKPDITIFDSSDIAILHHAIIDSWGKSAGEVSDASHRMEWKTREDGDLIPYEACWLSNDAPSRAEIVRTRELAEQHGW